MSLRSCLPLAVLALAGCAATPTHSERERRMLPLLIDAATAMDDVFWIRTYGDRDSLLASLSGNPDARRFAEINYGPWDRVAEQGVDVLQAGR